MSDTKNIKIVTADPSAIGLFGLAMVTLVASTQKLGLTDGVAFVLPWAIFLGAIAQLFACVQDSKHNNVFGATAFGAYGLFWLGVAMSWLIDLGVFWEKLAAAVDSRQLGVAFIGYLIFTLIMTIGSMETNKVLFFIFVLIDFLFIGLSLSTLGIMSHEMHMLAAVSELLIALLSFYGVAANVLNQHFGYTFIPVGKPFGIFKKHPTASSKKAA
ncbi:acetate uptake transporter [Bacillus massiliigorillae]|uniref:acetate uptake transporter n=1 Tax=Bacillus massiliigorillae TaxID=1243664 RepID=UPI0003A34E8A|nr:GPR1/FUN34/YaaH family transporter [Bacillus massiliigorillae]